MTPCCIHTYCIRTCLNMSYIPDCKTVLLLALSRFVLSQSRPATRLRKRATQKHARSGMMTAASDDLEIHCMDLSRVEIEKVSVGCGLKLPFDAGGVPRCQVDAIKGRLIGQRR